MSEWCADPQNRSSCTPCDPPWAAVGDFALLPLACDQNFDVVRGLWGFFAAVNFVAAVLCGVSLALAVKSSSSLLRTLRVSPNSRTVAFTAAYLLLFSVFGLLEATSPGPGQRSLGVDLVATLVFCAANSSMIAGAVIVDAQVLWTNAQFFDAADPFRARKIRHLSRMKYWHCLTDPAALPLLIVAIAQPQASGAIYQAFFTVLCIFGWLSSAIFFRHSTDLLLQMEKLKPALGPNQSAARSKLEAAMHYLAVVKRARIVSSLISGPILLIFGVVPGLIRRGAWILYPILMTIPSLGIMAAQRRNIITLINELSSSARSGPRPISHEVISSAGIAAEAAFGTVDTRPPDMIRRDLAEQTRRKRKGKFRPLLSLINSSHTESTGDAHEEKDMV